MVEGECLQLHFLQDSDDAVVLIPRSGTPRLKTAGGQMLDDALITVINGSLEITDARIGISSYEQFGTVTLPRWFVQVVNGNLSLRHCRIKGPSGASSRNRGLVRWTQLPVERKAEPTEGAYDQQALIVDSFLSCDQTLVNADARRRAFFMHNCVAVGNPVLALNITGSEPAIDGAVDMQRSTFCSLESVIVMRASPFGTPATSPLRIFSNHCVVAPPYKLGETTHQSALLRYGAPVIDERQVIWHEYFNAYAAATQFCLRESSAKSPPVVQPFSDWMQTQGVEQFSSPLLEPDGIRLTAELQRRDRIRAQDLALDSGCAAADGGDDGTALGADIQKIVAPLSRSSQPLPMQQKNPAGAAPQF